MIGVDEVRFAEKGITPNEAFFLKALNDKTDTTLGNMSNVNYLIDKGLMTRRGEITEEGKHFVKMTFFNIDKRPVQAPATEEVQELGEKIRELFPKGVKSGSYPVRGNLKNITRKLRKFKKEFPQYSDETILKAVEKYVKDKAKEQFQYMKISEYLIYKDNNSLLAALCDAVEEDDNGGDEPNWGHRV